MQKNTTHNNELQHSNSLYLRQHANNPVHWFPWTKEALKLARDSNKPIFLSIGYSACHWCHVMAHESFEDISVAELMNAQFINIKVDREERPDLDKIYQTCFQLLMQQGGGWPLTLFLNPHNLLPFFGGTYFPPTSHRGLPGLNEVLPRVAEYYSNKPKDVRAVNEALQKLLAESEQLPLVEDKQATEEILKTAIKLLSEYSDPENGGFGRTPKFPQPSLLYFLFDYLKQHTDVNVKNLLQLSLDKMAEGGIFDHIGGGFFRYTVDQSWQIPHFEKMLYDNGQLLGLYALTKNQNISHLTAQWIMREMQSPAGAYYATLDADSEGEEGKFYIWQRDEIKNLLNTQEYDVIEKHFDLDASPNFENHWHLTVKKPLTDKTHEIFEQARIKLLNARQKRLHPLRNEKIILAWNGLMIKGMILAGHHFNEPRYIQSAQHAVDDIFLHYFDQATKSFPQAFLDDYAFLLEGLVELLIVKHEAQYLEYAKQIADALLHHFADEKNGGFFFTSHSHEKLIYRPKPLMDEALPSGNGIATLALIRLGKMLSEKRYINFADKTLNFAWGAIQHAPHLHTTLLRATLEKNI